jgi:hypothetical protein
VPQSATLEDIGETLERYYAVNAQPFVRSLTQARFGPPAVASAALGAARQQLRHVRRALRQNLGFGSRLRGSASLRSLGL